MLARLFVYALALFYTWLLSLSYIFRWIKNPSVKFWRVKRRDVPPTCLNDPKYGQHAYVQLKDVKLHYVEHGDRSKPLMLFVHGFPEFWYSWRHQITEFAKDYWTVAIDMRGYGDSDKPKSTSSYEISLLIDDLKQLITQLGRETCVLVAHDWGGVVAWHFVTVHPNMVDRYVIMDAPYYPLYAKLVRSNLQQFLKSWYTFFFQLPYLPELFVRSYDFAGFARMLREGKEGQTSNVTDEDIEAFKYTFSKSGALTAPINYYRANMWTSRKEGSKDKKEGSGTQFPPGLLIFGENDNYLHSDLVRLSAETVKNLQTKIIPGANHFVQQDEPQAVNQAMKIFLAQKHH